MAILSPRSFCEWHLRHSSTFHFLLVTSGGSSLGSRFSTTLFITSTRSLSSLSFWVSLLISWLEVFWVTRSLGWARTRSRALLALERRSARPLSRLDVRVLLLQAITLRKAELLFLGMNIC